MKKLTIILSLMFAVFMLNAQITANFTWNDPQCAGESITFTDASTGDPATNWSWRVGDLELGNSSTFTYLFPLVTTATDYDILLAVNAGGYTDNITYTVTIYPLPNATIDIVDPTICEGTNIALTENAGDAISWAWSSGESTAGINPTVFVTTTYTVTVTDVNQCQNTANTTVYVNLIDTTAIADVFCEADTYDFFGTLLTSPGVYYYTTPSLVTGCDSVIELTLSMNLIDTTIVNDAFCQGDVYSFYGTDLDVGGTYYHTLTSVMTGCDSVIRLELVENSAYLFPETYEMCDGETYSWQGQDYTDAGTYYANYNTINGCDSIYELTLTVNYPFEELMTHSMCDGDSAEWRGTWYFATGTYEEYYTTINGCDSIYTFELTVNPLPTLYLVSTDPANGQLSGTDLGTILISDTQSDVQYKTTRGAATVHDYTYGTGSAMNLGTDFGAGNYEIWSMTDFGCVLKQATVTFTYDTGTPKIIGSSSYGNDLLSFVDNSVEMSLYEATVDINNDPVIIHVATQAIVGGNTEFADLSAGNYYLKSVVDTLQYPDVIPVWFYDGMSVDSADIIVLGVDDIFAFNINHPMFEDPTGSNTVGGSVDTIQSGGKSTTGIPDMVVIVRDKFTGNLIAVTITDADGAYYFGSIPDNQDLQVYVTSFESQNWTPANIATTENQDYIADFTVNGDAVYPASSGVEDVAKFSFEIYPNPASDFVILDGVPNGAKIYITSITGKMMLLDSRQHHNSLDVSDLPAGIYIVVIATDKGTMGVQKLIKQ